MSLPGLPEYGWIENAARTDSDMQTYFELLNSIVSSLWINNYRLYTVSNSPFADSPSTGSSNLYWGPTGAGNAFAQYISATEPYALGLPAQTAISNTWTNGTVYDIFVQLGSTSASVNFLISAWTSPTTPPTTRFSTNGGGQTCDPTGNYVYVGSVYYTGSAFFDYVGLRGVCNRYNQIYKPLFAQPSSSNFTTTSTSFASANGNTSYGGGRVGWMDGMGTAAPNLTAPGFTSNSASGNSGWWGFGVNNSSTPSVQAFFTSPAAGGPGCCLPAWTPPPNTSGGGIIGLNFAQLLVKTNGGTQTFYPGSAPTTGAAQSYITGGIFC